MHLFSFATLPAALGVYVGLPIPLLSPNLRYPPPPCPPPPSRGFRAHPVLQIDWYFAATILDDGDGGGDDTSQPVRGGGARRRPPDGAQQEDGPGVRSHQRRQLLAGRLGGVRRLRQDRGRRRMREGKRDKLAEYVLVPTSHATACDSVCVVGYRKKGITTASHGMRLI